MQVLFLVSVQLPVSSLGWPQFALWIDDCDPSLHQSSFSQVPFDVSIGAAFEESVFPPPTSPF